MKTLTKSMIALAILGATVMGTAGPSFARDARGAFGFDNAYGANAQVPTTRNGRIVLNREPARHHDMSSSWDSYGLRWDGGGN